MSRPNSAQRLNRLLAMVPWVVAQDGPTLDEVCRRFDVSEKELLADLNLLFMCGVYPFTPDALIEVDVDDGRVWVRCAEWFRRPLRLTPPEGLALVAAARAMLGITTSENDEEKDEGAAGGRADGGAGSAAPTAAGGTDGLRPRALARAAAKLESVLGTGGQEAVDVELGQASPDVMSTLQQAVREARKVRLDYYSFGRDETGERVVQPWRLFSSEGNWYLLAWCENVDGKRLFRVDRARGAQLLDDHFQAPPEVGAVPTYEASPEDPVVVLDLSPAARWVAERYPHEHVDDLGQGHLRVRLRVSSRPWLERLLLRAGPDVTVVSGAEGVARSAARRVLAAYGHVTFGE
jgi:proteasome accessory factor C